MNARQSIDGVLAAGRGLFARAAQTNPLGQALERGWSTLSGRGFACRAEQFTGEGPAGRDQYFCVQMTGLIPTPQDNFSTDVRVEITDITDGTSSPEPVLSVEPKFQSGKDRTFFLQTCNGIVPKRNAVLARWITVAQIPCHVLRFACRGRRRLAFCVQLVGSEDGQVLTAAQDKIDYVNCTDGFRERFERKLEVLKSTLRVAALAGLENAQLETAGRELMRQWLNDKAAPFGAATQLNDALGLLEKEAAEMNVSAAADRLLAWGEQEDKEAAVTLAMQVAASRHLVSEQRFCLLIETAKLLSVRKEFFLAQAQQHFLTAGCQLEDPWALLAIDASAPTEQIVKQLTDEYRRWNARVTHPDADIRLQADRMLTLIADLRSRQLNPNL